MIFKKIQEKLILAYRFFVASPKMWRLPKKSEILLYDVCGTENLTQYLVNYNCETLATEGEWVNVPCMLMALFNVCFFGGHFLREYNKNYIRRVDPRIIITCIDNNPQFYSISVEYPHIKTIFIQNGLRTARSNLFINHNINDKYHVDYMFVFSNAIGRVLSQHITGTTISIGSLKNNSLTINNKYECIGNTSIKKPILFISQYRPTLTEKSSFFIEINGKLISHDVFFSAECMVLNFLGAWCNDHNRLLVIAGASSSEHEQQERAFYAANLDGFNWTYSARTHAKRSYELVDEAEIVVFIDSTLGYEAFARGKKIAALSCRGFVDATLAADFGWPAKLSEDGPFWTNKLNEKQFQRIMDYLVGLSEFEWQTVRNSFDTNEIMCYDQNNTSLVALLKDCLLNE